MSFVSCLGVFSATVHTAEIIHHTETQGTQRSTSFSVFSAFFAVKLSLVMNSTVNGYVFPTGRTDMIDFSLQPEITIRK
jgi:hypothetical protein